MSVDVRPTSSFHLYKSLDQGRSWAEVGSGLPQSVRINALAIAGAIAFAGSDAGIFISTDEGQTWSENARLPIARVQCVTVVGEQVFAGTQQAGVFVSQDGGRSWEQLVSGLTELTQTFLSPFAPKNQAAKRRKTPLMITPLKIGHSMPRERSSLRCCTFFAKNFKTVC